MVLFESWPLPSKTKEKDKAQLCTGLPAAGPAALGVRAVHFHQISLRCPAMAAGSAAASQNTGRCQRCAERSGMSWWSKLKEENRGGILIKAAASKRLIKIMYLKWFHTASASFFHIATQTSKLRINYSHTFDSTEADNRALDSKETSLRSRLRTYPWFHK